MISYRTKVKLGRIIQLIGQQEWEIEQANYELYTVFKRIDRQRKGHIDMEDLREFLLDNQFIKESEQSDMILQEMDKNKDDIISYSEFSQYMQCKQNERQPYSIQQFQKLEFDLEWNICKMFQLSLKHTLEITREQNDLLSQYDWNSQEAFDCIDLKGKGVIDVQQLDQFIKQHDVYLSDQQFDSLFWKVDVNRNGVINFKSFVNMIMPLNYNPNRSVRYKQQSQPSLNITNQNLYSSQRVNRNMQSTINAHIIPSNTIINNNSNSNINNNSLMSKSQSKKINENQELNDQYLQYSQSRVNPHSQMNLLSQTNHHSQMPQSQMRSNIERLHSPQYKKTELNFYSPSRDRVFSPLRNNYQQQQVSQQPQLGISRSKVMSNMNTQSKMTPSRYRMMSPNIDQQQYSRYRSPVNNSSLLSNNVISKSPLRKSEEYFLINLLQQQIYLDKQLEQSKQQLILKNDFNLLDGFRYLDQQAKGFLTKLDFQNVLIDLGVNFTSQQISLFFKRFDKDNDGLLKYSDFCRIVSPVSQQYLKIIKQKQPFYDNSKTLSWESKNCLKQLMQVSLDSEVKSEQLRQQLSQRQFNIVDAFDSLDRNDNGFLTPQEFRTMLEQYGVYVNNRDLQTLLNRYDKNNDGKVSYSEFYQELRPKSPRKI